MPAPPIPVIGDPTSQALPQQGLATPRINAFTARRRWLLTWAGRVCEFSFVQCWVQLFTAASGLLVVRTLAKDQYALYAIASSMQATCIMLADLGIGMGVNSIGGRVWQDPARFGQLVNTALQMRRRFAIVSLATCLPITAWMLSDNGASWQTILILSTLIVAGISPQITGTVLLVVPHFHGEYRRIQKLGFWTAVLRLAMIGGLALSRMNAALAASVGAVTSWTQMLVAKRWAADHADLSAPPNAEDRRELWRLSTRIFPNTLFYCFQGQVTLLILTLLGNPTGIADLTALGRLSALLIVFSLAFNSVLVPRFARCQDPERLSRLYLVLIAATAITVTPIVLAGWLLPQPLLWLLGEQYARLEHECGWVVSTACVSHLAMAMKQLNGARSWIRIGSVVYAPLTITIQILLLTRMDVSQLRGVVVFSFLTSLIALPTLLADAYLGLRARTRQSRRYE